MKIRKVGVTRTFTLNCGNYESAKLGAWCEVELDDHDDPDDAFQLASEFVHEKVSQDMADLDPGTE